MFRQNILTLIKLALLTQIDSNFFGRDMICLWNPLFADSPLEDPPAECSINEEITHFAIFVQRIGIFQG